MIPRTSVTVTTTLAIPTPTANFRTSHSTILVDFNRRALLTSRELVYTEATLDIGHQLAKLPVGLSLVLFSTQGHGIVAALCVSKLEKTLDIRVFIGHVPFERVHHCLCLPATGL